MMRLLSPVAFSFVSDSCVLSCIDRSCASIFFTSSFCTTRISSSACSLFSRKDSRPLSVFTLSSAPDRASCSFSFSFTSSRHRTDSCWLCRFSAATCSRPMGAHAGRDEVGARTRAAAREP